RHAPAAAGRARVDAGDHPGVPDLRVGGVPEGLSRLRRARPGRPSPRDAPALGKLQEVSADVPRAARAVEEFLRALGAPIDSDPELAETGRRVAEAFANDLLSGYAQDPKAILAESTTSPARGMVLVTGIATSTTCPHHLMPAPGVAHVGYLPGDRVVGLGALARLVDCYAHRLILQE